MLNLKNSTYIISLERTNCLIQEEFGLGNCDGTPEKIASVGLGAELYNDLYKLRSNNKVFS